MLFLQDACFKITTERHRNSCHGAPAGHLHLWQRGDPPLSCSHQVSAACASLCGLARPALARPGQNACVKTARSKIGKWTLRSASRTFTLSATRVLFPVAVLLNDSCMRKPTTALQQVRQGDGPLWGASRMNSLWQATCDRLLSSSVQQSRDRPMRKPICMLQGSPQWCVGDRGN